VLKAGNWYVIASEGDVVRGYRADRFEHVAVSGQQFSRPPGFDLSAFWATWREKFKRGLPVVTVTVRARSGCARRLRRVVESAHAHEVNWDTLPDETGWVRLLLPFEKLEFAQAGLLGFGADIEVLGPQELRNRIIATAAALSALYAEHQPRVTRPPQRTCPTMWPSPGLTVFWRPREARQHPHDSTRHACAVASACMCRSNTRLHG